MYDRFLNHTFKGTADRNKNSLRRNLRALSKHIFGSILNCNCTLILVYIYKIYYVQIFRFNININIYLQTYLITIVYQYQYNIKNVLYVDIQI